MPNPRGRPTNEERARRAAEAASQAHSAAQEVVPELPVESPHVESQHESPHVENEEKSEIIYRAPRNDIRKQAMEEIEQRDIQTKTGLGMELGLTDEEKPKVETNKEIPQDPSPPTAESMLQGGKFSPPTSKQKVDGVEYDVSPEEIESAGGDKAWRAGKAAENRLQKANEALAEVRKLQETKPTQTSPDEFLTSKIETLRWGTKEESAQAIKDIVEKLQGKPIDQNMVVEMAADRIRHDEAVKAFDKEFQDIGSSPLHLKLVVAMRQEKLQQGHPGDWNNFYRSLGNEVRSVMPKQSQPKQTTATSGTPSQASDKEERKSSIVNLPTAAQRATLPEEPKPESREETLNAMRKKRGFPIS